jgi:hypothetical protein
LALGPDHHQQQLPHFMEKKYSSQANSSLTTQEIPLVFRNPKVYFRVQQIPPLVSLSREINPCPSNQFLND